MTEAEPQQNRKLFEPKKTPRSGRLNAILESRPDMIRKLFLDDKTAGFLQLNKKKVVSLAKEK